MLNLSLDEGERRADYIEAFLNHPERAKALRERRAALLCIDVQYLDAAPGYGLFTDPDASGVSEEGRSYYFSRLKKTVLPNMRRLQELFRDSSLEVIHCRICALTNDGRDRSKGHKRLNLLAAPDSKEAEFLPEVAPFGDEIIINKTASGAFPSTNLHYVLQNMEIETLYMVGVYTNECVETTARDACDLGYFVTVVDDACATVSQELHEASLGVLKFRYANVMTTQEVLHEVRRETHRNRGER
ncbi:cysteine hydrolase family protein [Roseibacillus ishigakijimensis]|uniref:Cysteine hydrolase n=1 Tax=Roseibacillus ishigakijimensis TaxID=454146 RepID=A0A934VJS0_9BACT|nr:isochorismatase family cysteine hydrolase [Roseibacillus ishigakijimensis]MBK1832894.1 cysteine hydrolase [Roseibacillus ishigakijimensis]